MNNLTNEKLADEIRLLQNIQMKCHPDSQDWKFASRQLAPRFEEAAARQKRGEIVPCLNNGDAA